MRFWLPISRANEADEGRLRRFRRSQCHRSRRAVGSFSRYHGRGCDGFELFTVSEKAAPVEMTGGLRMIPGYTFADAPHPDIVVVAAQRARRLCSIGCAHELKIAES